MNSKLRWLWLNENENLFVLNHASCIQFLRIDDSFTVMIVLLRFICLLVFYFFLKVKLIKAIWNHINVLLVGNYLYFITSHLLFFYDFSWFLTCLFLFVVSILWAISSFTTLIFFTSDFFHTIVFKGKFYTDSGSRLPFAKLFNGLAEKFPTEKIPQLKHLIECNFF